jgi:hypothetical protein
MMLVLLVHVPPPKKKKTKVAVLLVHVPPPKNQEEEDQCGGWRVTGRLRPLGPMAAKPLPVDCLNFWLPRARACCCAAPLFVAQFPVVYFALCVYVHM